ncbi:MAG: phosphodiesterase [Deltaproteobacteria bacterium]|nr:phosphodiesterase [Candidatus Anaeroferrophillacea bacterium]
MKIGIISDTHGSVAAWKQAMDGPFLDVDMIFHAGDLLYHGARNPFPFGYHTARLADLLNSCPVPLVIARGNCDSAVDQTVLNYPIHAPMAFVQMEGLRYCIMHGDHGTLQDQLQTAHRFRADFLVTGHTHIRNLKRENDIVHINPGSAALPKDHLNGSVAVVDTLQKTVVIIDLENGEELAALGYGGS